MGYFLLFLIVVAELLSLAGSYAFGTFVIGPRVGGGDSFHWIGQHFVHLSPSWRQLFLHADGRAWGVVWVALNLLLQIVAIQASVRKLHKARQGLGKPEPGSEEWNRVQSCYQRFFQASIQHYPAIEFKTPHSFRYVVGADSYDVEFIGRRLVIGQNLLTPNNRHLPPLLAHQLAYYNSGDLWFRMILDYCPEVWFIRFLIIGMPIAAPTLIRDYIWPWLYWRKRVFAADEFACRMGQCDALIRTLEARRHFQRRRGPFRSEPYIQERIHRLKQWRANRLQPPQAQVRTHP